MFVDDSTLANLISIMRANDAIPLGNVDRKLFWDRMGLCYVSVFRSEVRSGSELMLNTISRASGPIFKVRTRTSSTAQPYCPIDQPIHCPNKTIIIQTFLFGIHSQDSQITQ